jgi:hypothetical protein
MRAVAIVVACLVAIVVVLVPSPVLAVGGDKAMYVGGTAPVPEKSEGPMSTAAEDKLTFTPKQKGATPLVIPYASITSLEYGQKAGRRVAVAVLVSPLALFSKKRNHYLTISYKDAAEKEQAGVFELGKDIVRTTLKVLEVRSGKQIEYQDDEAKKSGMGGK